MFPLRGGVGNDQSESRLHRGQLADREPANIDGLVVADNGGVRRFVGQPATNCGVDIACDIPIGIFDGTDRPDTEERLRDDVEPRFFLDLAHCSDVRFFSRIHDSCDRSPFVVVGAPDKEDLGDFPQWGVWRQLRQHNCRNSGQPQMCVADVFAQLKDEIWRRHIFIIVA